MSRSKIRNWVHRSRFSLVHIYAVRTKFVVLLTTDPCWGLAGTVASEVSGLGPNFDATMDVRLLPKFGFKLRATPFEPWKAGLNAACWFKEKFLNFPFTPYWGSNLGLWRGCLTADTTVAANAKVGVLGFIKQLWFGRLRSFSVAFFFFPVKFCRNFASLLPWPICQPSLVFEKETLSRSDGPCSTWSWKTCSGF